MPAASHAVAPPPELGRPLQITRLSDELLARHVARGSDRAFTALYERYHQPLYRYCRSILRDDVDAQDALQSAFIGALSALRQDRRTAPLRPWLFRIAHNEAISLLRERRRDGERQLAGGPAVSSSAEEEASARARWAALVKDLGELPERQRGALLLRELSGLSHAEIAIALGISVGGAKQAIFEARQALSEVEEGRAMSCEEVRRRLSEGDRRVLRGRRVRSHLRGCSSCELFAAAIPSRRSQLRAFAPVLPPAAAAALLTRSLRAAAAHAGSGAAATAGAAATTATSGSAATSAGASTAATTAGAVGKAAGAAIASKALVSAAVIATAAAGVTGLVQVLHRHHSPTARPLVQPRPEGATPRARGQGLVARSPSAGSKVSPGAGRGHGLATIGTGAAASAGHGAHARGVGTAGAFAGAQGVGAGSSHGSRSAAGSHAAASSTGGANGSTGSADSSSSQPSAPGKSSEGHGHANGHYPSSGTGSSGSHGSNGSGGAHRGGGPGLRGGKLEPPAIP